MSRGSLPCEDLFLTYILFDDEIDSIRAFNVETQLSESKQESISIIPAGMADNDTAGVSLLHFADAATIVICQSVNWLETRIKAISSETLSEAVCVTGEGETDAMKNVVDYDDFVSRMKSMKIVEFGGDADAGSAVHRGRGPDQHPLHPGH